MYFIDWYDPQKCHKTDPLVWDRGNGRIYRLKYDSTWKPWKGDLTASSDKQLGEIIASTNGWHSRAGLKLFHERSARSKQQGTTPPLHAALDGFAVQSAKVIAPGTPNPSILSSSLMMRPAFMAHLSESRDKVMYQDILSFTGLASALPLNIRLASENSEILNSSTDNLLTLAGGTTPKVRLAIASALQKLPLDQRWDIAAALIQHAEDAKDHNLPQMYWYAIEPLVPADPDRALALAEISKIPLVSENIARRASALDGGVPHLVKALAKEKTGDGAVYLLKAAIEGWRGRDSSPAPAGWDAAYSNIDDILKRRPDAKDKDRAAEIQDLREALAVSFGDKRAFPKLRELALDAQAAPDRRQRALQTLLQGKDPEAPGILTTLLNDSALRLAAIRALPGVSAPPEILAKPATVLLAQYATLSPSEKQAAIATLSGRADWANLLLDAIGETRIPRAELTSFAARQIANFNNPPLTEKLTKNWGAIAAASASGDTAAEIAKFKTVLTPEFLRTANLPAGRALFNTTCGTCHTLFGQGQHIGPDLTGSNRADIDYILENIVNPNALIGKDYELHLITLKDGRSLAGMIRGETPAALTVQSLTGSETVSKTQITAHETPGFSMMPPGQLTAFTPDQQRDLIAYLAAPSQVPLPGEPGAEKYAVANRIPGALEGENLQSSATGGKATAQSMEGFIRGNWSWSGAAQLWWTGGNPGDRLDLTLPVATAGTYEVQIVLTKASDYASLRFLLDGKPVGKPFDGFSPPGAGVIHTPPMTLTKTELLPGDHRLTLEITGCNPEAAKNYMAGIDYIYLKRE